MLFKASSFYSDNLSSLLKKYPTVQKDISNEFDGLTFQEIFQKKYILKDSGDHKILKIRIANSEQNKGKSAGFRLIAVLDRKKELIVFIAIYPKVGNQGKDNLSKEELKDCLNTYKKEAKTDTLTEIDLFS